MSAPKSRRSKKEPRPELPPNIAVIACEQDGYDLGGIEAMCKIREAVPHAHAGGVR